jgi:hypothetical protein
MDVTQVKTAIEEVAKQRDALAGLGTNNKK